MQRTSLQEMLQYVLIRFNGYEYTNADIGKVSGAEAVLSKL